MGSFFALSLISDAFAQQQPIDAPFYHHSTSYGWEWMSTKYRTNHFFKSTVDGDLFSVLFAQYQSDTRPRRDQNPIDDKKTLDERSCKIAVNIDVKPEYSVSIVRVDTRGRAMVPPQDGSYAEVNLDYNFAGIRCGTLVRRFFLGYNKNALVFGGGPIWSPCGASTGLRVYFRLASSKILPTN